MGIRELLIDGPYAIWMLDEKVGATQALDSSTNNQHSQINSTAPPTFGVIGYSERTVAQFTNNTQRLYGPWASNAVFDNWTVEFWHRPVSTVTSYSEANGGTAMAGNVNRWVFYPEHGGDGNNCGWGLSIGTNGIFVAAHSANFAPCVGAWASTITSVMHHFTIVCAARRCHIYMDGVLRRSGQTIVRNNWMHRTFGAEGTNLGGNPHGGQIAEVAFYNKVLTDAQIAAHFNAGMSSPQGVWRWTDYGSKSAMVMG